MWLLLVVVIVTTEIPKSSWRFTQGYIVSKRFCVSFNAYAGIFCCVISNMKLLIHQTGPTYSPLILSSYPLHNFQSPSVPQHTSSITSQWQEQRDCKIK